SAGALRASARASLDRIGAKPGARWLCALPTSHIAGLGVLVRSLVSGATPVVVDRLDPAPRHLAAVGCDSTPPAPPPWKRRRTGQTRAPRCLCPPPTGPVAGLGVLVRSLVPGATPVVVARLAPAQRALAAFGCDYTPLVPARCSRSRTRPGRAVPVPAGRRPP